MFLVVRQSKREIENQLSSQSTYLNDIETYARILAGRGICRKTGKKLTIYNIQRARIVRS